MLKNIFSFAVCKVFNNQCVIMWFCVIFTFEMFRKYCALSHVSKCFESKNIMV